MVIFTDSATKDLNDITNNANIISKDNTKVYINNLLYYIGILDKMKHLGKRIPFKIKHLEIRQLIYSKHRIIYQIKNDNIYIISIIHTKKDFIKFLLSLKL